jgi:hypothetical protein
MQTGGKEAMAAVKKSAKMCIVSSVFCKELICSLNPNLTQVNLGLQMIINPINHIGYQEFLKTLVGPVV